MGIRQRDIISAPSAPVHIARPLQPHLLAQNNSSKIALPVRAREDEKQAGAKNPEKCTKTLPWHALDP